MKCPDCGRRVVRHCKNKACLWARCRFCGGYGYQRGVWVTGVKQAK